MGFISSHGSNIPQTRFILLNESQQRAINAIMFGKNYLLIAEDEKGSSFVDMNIDDDLLFQGLESVCKSDQKFIDRMTDFVIDLHTKK